MAPPGSRRLGPSGIHGADAGAGAAPACTPGGAAGVQAQQQPETLGEQAGKNVHGGIWLFTGSYSYNQFTQSKVILGAIIINYMPVSVGFLVGP